MVAGEARDLEGRTWVRHVRGERGMVLLEYTPRDQWGASRWRPWEAGGYVRFNPVPLTAVRVVVRGL